jgi:hypothetical protein
MTPRPIRALLAAVALVGLGFAVYSGNTPLTLAFLVGFIFWSIKAWRPDL